MINSKRVVGHLILITLPWLIGCADESGGCGQRPPGIYSIKVQGKASILSVSKEQSPTGVGDSASDAINRAELSAKAALAKTLSSEKLSGINRLYQCEVDGVYYAGVFVNLDSLKNVEVLRRALSSPSNQIKQTSQP